MNKWNLLLLLMLTTLYSYSQGLTPQIHHLNGDTTFCFSKEQSKWIAGQLTHCHFQDSLILELEQQQKHLKDIATKKDQVIFNHQQEIEVHKASDEALNKTNELLTQEVNTNKTEIKKAKRNGSLFLSGWLATVGAWIIHQKTNSI